MPERARERYERFGRRAVFVLLALGVALLVVAITAATFTIQAMTADTDQVEETLRRQASVNRLSTFNEQIANGRRGFLLQPDPEFARVIREASAEFEKEQANLRASLERSSEQYSRLESIRRLNAERTVIIDEMFSEPERAFRQARSGAFNLDRGVLVTQDIRGLVEQMANVERQELVRRSGAQLDSLLRFYVVGGLALALLLIVLVTVIVLVLRYNRDLTTAQAKLKTANEGLEVAVSARTAELLRANEEIQRFAYIVSHDLRSPLVNVLGFTSELDEARGTIRNYLVELFDSNPDLRNDEVWAAVEDDLPEALAFIRTSTEKMDRLINSILELSRQGRRPLTPEELDMTELAEGVVASLHQLAEEAGANVSVHPLPSLESDHITIEQILSNLVENALKYLSPERVGEVTIEGRRAGKMVEIDVVDNGRGIDPRDQERVFELFRRAGAQDRPGEGLGLANVRALAYRLGGTIDVQSELDQGARFRLSLPARFVSREPIE